MPIGNNCLSHFAVRSARYAYQFMKSSVASKLSVLRLLLEGRLSVGCRSPDIASSPEGDEKRRLDDDATEYSTRPAGFLRLSKAIVGPS